MLRSRPPQKSIVQNKDQMSFSQLSFSLLSLWSLSLTANRLVTALCSPRSPLAALCSHRSPLSHRSSPLTALCSLSLSLALVSRAHRSTRRGRSLPLSPLSDRRFPALSLSRSLSPKSLAQTLNLCRRCDCGCDEASALLSPVPEIGASEALSRRRPTPP
ncbi:hypothetical protein Scep_003613 [Stephania cephalantha]|uniref:Uncharacterized protein n=1 Tax=Stephania cephalantha TaxID=152367 RepID=A0AAP0KSF8_9MAGN